MTAPSEAIPLSIYVHFPWCVRKCPYCDFNSHELREELPEAAYIKALLEDMAVNAQLAEGRPIRSIFFGGGTPSLFSGKSLRRLLVGAQAMFKFETDIEITLEANPGTLETCRFADYLDSGVNRLSIGVQSFRDAQLKVLGRIHSAKQAIAAFEQARESGFSNINIDLMYALPSDSVPDALWDLEIAAQLDPEHISWYQLTLEPNTPFYRTPPDLPEHDESADMQEAGQALLQAAGYGNYETSAYASPGHQCRHNRNYWEFGDYLAFGAGAHSKVTDRTRGAVFREVRPRSPRQYLALTDYRMDRVDVPVSELPFEFMINALRLIDGFPSRLFNSRTGLSLTEIAEPLDRAVALGLLEPVGEVIRPSTKGRLFLNDLLQLFLPDRELSLNPAPP